MIDALRGHTSILLDTCVWIYHLEGNPRYLPTTRQLLRHIADGDCRAACSELTLLEIKVGPLMKESVEAAGKYELFLDAFPNLCLIPIDRSVLSRAARLRARFGLKTPDAIILATGLTRGTTLAVTNDRGWKKVEEIEVVCLEDLAGAA